ncbi:hypothetical protein ACIQU4_09055 [Streptomyces sp. NPDC090741]|uniref:hypothetical protein n=1 Tax=Streptomyces sp. NPDC090741 TaxID=3365967 RepID=UPI00380EDC02
MAAWGRTDVRAPIAVGLVLLAAFVCVELRSNAPGFDPRLLAQRTFGAILGAPLGAGLVRRCSLRPVAAPALTAAALTTGAYGYLGLQTPLLRIEILLLARGLSIGMVIGPVTAALINSLPPERAGAGSAVTNTVRQAGSVIGIAVGGTIMSIVYRGEIEPSLSDVPGPARDRARVSAEQARHVATAIHRPALAHAADDAFLHAMHVGAAWIMLIALFGAAVPVAALRPDTKPAGPVQEPAHDRDTPRIDAASG